MFKIAIKKLKRYKLLGIDQIPAELVQAQAGDNTLSSEIHKLIRKNWHGSVRNLNICTCL
jgi:hypothetical protein